MQRNECSCHNRKHIKTEYFTASPTFQSLRWKVREHCFSLNPHGVYDDLWMKIPEIKINKLRSAIRLVRECESKKEDRTKEEKEFIKLGITLDLFQLVFFNFFLLFCKPIIRHRKRYSYRWCVCATDETAIAMNTEFGY